MKIHSSFAFVIALVQLAIASPFLSAASKPTVNVCLDPSYDLYNVTLARDLASELFANSGIGIQWHGRKCPADAIQIAMSFRTPSNVLPETVGFALPEDGTCILLFYDRIQAVIESYRFPVLLGHVLAHEITHILQGVRRHSEKGIMKATWSRQDYDQMEFMALTFTDEDVELIHRGLEQRAARSHIAASCEYR